MLRQKLLSSETAPAVVSFHQNDKEQRFYAVNDVAMGVSTALRKGEMVRQILAPKHKDI